MSIENSHSERKIFPLNFAFAYGRPEINAKFRTCNEDFIVKEELGFELDGSGEHVCVHVKKNGENTQWVADKLAHYFNVKNMDVGFCGMKDRHAITSQWFSVYLPGFTDDVNWADFISAYGLNIEVLDSVYHGKKLRKGAHKSNHFTICLRDLENNEGLDERLEKIKSMGVPNYFGEQRFGRDGNNLSFGDQWVNGETKIKNRTKRGLIMSSLRSYIFNLVVDARVKEENWQASIEGDVVNECGNATGPLWGRGRSEVQGKAMLVERQALELFSDWTDKLEHVGLSQERRPLVLKPIDFSWDKTERNLTLSFSLSTGQFATSILREVCLLDDQSQRPT